MKGFLKSLSVIAVISLLSGCATISGIGTDNTPPPSPLVAFTPEMNPVQLWVNSTGVGTNEKVFNFVPALSGNTVFTADQRGTVTATDTITGHVIWQVMTNQLLTAGPSTNGYVVVVGTTEGELIALQATTGKIIWRTLLPNEILGLPQLNANQVILETVDGNLMLLNAQTGLTEWTYNHGAPTMILRGGSTPQFAGNYVIAGFADGKVAAYNLAQGRILWETAVSQPMGGTDVEQMSDIVTNPIVSDGMIYTVNYQGNIVAITGTGQVIWQHPLSSYTGMAISDQLIFVTDTQGDVWAFDRNSGAVVWRQTQLENRILTAPVVQGNMLVVADAEGYLHWMSQQDGHIVARVVVSANDRISAAPVVYGNRLYVLNDKGLLAAYRLQ